MPRFALLWWGLLCIILLTRCSQPHPLEPPEDDIKQTITQRFDAAYQGLLTISQMTLTPAQSTLNTEDHRVYDVQLTAVVQQDLQQALNALPETMENAIMRGRIKGIMRLGAVRPGEQMSTRLRALVERNPETGQWAVVGLIHHRPNTEPSQNNQGDTHAAAR